MNHSSLNDFKKIVSRIALIDGYEYRYLLLAICQYLKSHFNSYICVYVQSKDAYCELISYVNKGYIDDVKMIPAWKSKAQEIIDPKDATAIFNKAVENEQLFNITYNKVRMTRRDLGLGFYLGAYYHPKSVMSEEPSYLQIVHAYNYIFDFWKEQLSGGKISLVINGLKEEEIVAHAFNIPFRYLFCTRIDNYFYWTRNLFCEFPEVKNHYMQLINKNFDPIELQKQFFLDLTHKKKILNSSRLKRFISKVFSLVYENSYRILKRRYAKGYYFGSYLRFLYKEYRDIKKLTYPNMLRLSDLEGKKFIYFPLATEPELSLHWMSPECTSQLAIIHKIARDLPADTILVVKEAIYALGKRSREFYEHIRRLKNTVLLDVKEEGVNIVSKAAVIATISGTGGLEAAIIGKPVILFGRHNYYDFLDHVFLVHQDEQLAPAIQAALHGHYDIEKAKIDGARLRQAAINASFNLKKFTTVRRNEFNNQILDNVVMGLRKSLSHKIIVNELSLNDA